MDQITECLYVGAMSDLNPLGDTEVEPHEFTNVVTLGNGETPHTTEQYGVENREGTEDEFFAAVDAVRGHLGNPDELTFVHCTAGVSRGTTVVATALAADRDITLEEAFEEVQQLHENTAPHPDLQYMAQEYLAAQTDTYSHTDLYTGDKEERGLPAGTDDTTPGPNVDENDSTPDRDSSSSTTDDRGETDVPDVSPEDDDKDGGTTDDKDGDESAEDDDNATRVSLNPDNDDDDAGDEGDTTDNDDNADATDDGGDERDATESQGLFAKIRSLFGL